MNAAGRVLSFAAACLAAFASAADAPPPPTLRPFAPAEGAVVPLLSAGQKAFFDAPAAERRARFRDPVWRRAATRPGYRPQPVRLEWEWTSDADPPGNYRVRLERKGLGDSDGYEAVADFVTADSWLDLTNLEVGRDYRWVVSGGWQEAAGTFSTEPRAPRLLDVPGVPNARDLGGWVGRGGRRVRQGLVVRSAAFNDNAYEEYCSEDELVAADTDGLRAAALAAIAADEARLREMQADPGSVRFVDAAPGSRWTLFRVEGAAPGAAELSAVADVPATFCGAPGEPWDDPAEGFLGNPKDARGPAVLMQRFEAPEDGYVLLGCGGDWWWSLRLNGAVLYDCSAPDRGNGRNPISSSNHVVLAPVRKGSNLLVASVATGTAGWRWFCKAAPAEPLSRAFSDSLATLEALRRPLERVVKRVVPGPSRVTPATRAVALDTLGLRTEIDLRSDKECRGMEGSPLGPEVRRVQISSGAYGGMQEDEGREAFAKVFRIFLDPDAYGIDFHCIAGQDRTGAVSFVLLALLGVSEDDLRLDWETTALWNPRPGFNHADRYDKLDKWPGETIGDRVEAYVLSLGFTEADVAALRNRLLEPEPPRCHEACK